MPDVPTPADPPVEDLRARLERATLADATRLGARLRKAQRTDDPARRAEALTGLATDVAAAEAHLVRRLAAVPTVTYPPELPVAQRRDDLAAAIEAHPVVVVAGETGSGKTTQLPKICLELGRGTRGMIGHTQPRRLAARTVADRIATELGVELGGAVGHAVRFTDQVGPETLIKVMTDGLLLAELRGDRDLLAYDTIIVDEAHERSLNIDVLIGHLTHLRRRRPDLKVIITSATIDPEAFSRHFDDAPIIEVSGRTYPVEIRYRPLGPTDDHPDLPVRDLFRGITDAVTELRREGPGDILVFLSGEREIRDAARILEDLDLPDTEVLPLYARLPMAEQRRAFAQHRGRRIVLATNVAETSITVPGIRYVIDPGTARTSRYSHRLKVQRLPIEPVSQASAAQRAGRCGRVAPGICIRLYDEADHDDRPEFTEPEILRTNLASVILQLSSLGLGDVARFPFLDPPEPRAVADGVRLLHELGAVELDGTGDVRKLTPVGRRLARLPVDPRFARMILAAADEGCLRQVLVIVAALSIEDPRERPTDQRAEADAAHARFAEPGSDFLALWHLWGYVRDLGRQLSGNQLRRRCRAEHLSYLRLREWQDVHTQLRRVVRDLGLRVGDGEAHPDAVHRALLAGLLSHVGRREGDRRDYRGARNARFTLWPGSSLARTPPSWVMAAELVETSQLWGRTAARIRPEWAEEVGAHLVQRRHGDPLWSPEQGLALVAESVTLFGLPLAADRLVPLARHDEALARRLFIRKALVDGEADLDHPALAANRELLDSLTSLEDRYRRRDLVVGPEALTDRYDERLGDHVTSTRTFRRWLQRTGAHHPDALTLTVEDLLAGAADDLDPAAFPEWWIQGDQRFALSYVFDPTDPFDGVTVHLPLTSLTSVRAEGFDWSITGLRPELVTTLLRGLPKVVRTALPPVGEVVEGFLAAAGPDDGPLREVLARHVSHLAGVAVTAGELDATRLPRHLRTNFRVEDADGEGLAEGDDLAALRRALAPQVRQAIGRATADLEREGLRSWDVGTVPRQVTRRIGDTDVVGYPALVDTGDAVALRVLGSAEDAHEATWAGCRRLVRLAVPVPARAVRDRLTADDPSALLANPEPSLGALLEACLTAALDDVLTEAGAPAWDEAGFGRLVTAARQHLADRAVAVAGDVAQVLSLAHQLDQRLAAPAPPHLDATYADVAQQRAALVSPGLVGQAGSERLAHLARYLRAALHRLDAARRSPQRDRQRMVEVHHLESSYGELVDAATAHGLDATTAVELEHLGWLLEELRVQRFAEHLGTAEPVSPTRVRNALTAAAAHVRPVG